MLTILFHVIVLVLLFGLTIFVHELGHFLVARWCGLQVDAFSIGFGKAIWQRTYNGVVYKIAWLPLGGYVALPQMDPTGGLARGEEQRALPRVAPWKKIAVGLAGVVGNMIFAFFLAIVVYKVGKPAELADVNTVVGYVETNSVAYAQGVRIGDEIKEVAGRSGVYRPVAKWEEIRFICAVEGEVTLKLATAEGERLVTLPTEKSDMGIWMLPGLGPMDYASVAAVEKGSSAEEAGLRACDLIVGIDGAKLYSFGQLVDYVAVRPAVPVVLDVERGGATLQVTAVPRFDPEAGRARIGFRWNPNYVDPRAVIHPTPWAQVSYYSGSIFRFLDALTSPAHTAKASQAVSGPIYIFLAYWLIIQSSLMMAVSFTVFFNVNLAIFNLIPFPVLDGGHIVFALWEWVTRRPLAPRFVAAVWNLSACLLIALFLSLTFRDVKRILPIFRSSSKPAVEQPAVEEPVEAPATP